MTTQSKAFTKAWTRVVAATLSPAERQVRSLEKRRPWLTRVLNTKVDLLSPLERAFVETLHTRALRYFLDPTESHGLGVAPLKAIWKLAAGGPAPSNLGDALILAERSYSLSPKQKGRTDLWIECGPARERSLLLLELKVNSGVGSKQLERYSKYVWALPGYSHRHLVLLSRRAPDFELPNGWKHLPWRDLAVRLSKASQGDSEGHAFLRAYLASVLQQLEGVPAHDESAAASRAIPLPHGRCAVSTPLGEDLKWYLSHFEEAEALRYFEGNCPPKVKESDWQQLTDFRARANGDAADLLVAIDTELTSSKVEEWRLTAERKRTRDFARKYWVVKFGLKHGRRRAPFRVGVTLDKLGSSPPSICIYVDFPHTVRRSDQLATTASILRARQREPVQQLFDPMREWYGQLVLHQIPLKSPKSQELLVAKVREHLGAFLKQTGPELHEAVNVAH